MTINQLPLKPARLRIASLIASMFLCVLGLQSAAAQGAPPPIGCSCKSQGGDDDDARTPITANVAEAVKAQVEEAFKGLAVDAESQLKKLDQALAVCENENKNKPNWDPIKFLEIKENLIRQLREKLQQADKEVSTAIQKMGTDMGKELQNRINHASPKVVGLASYEHCLDPCEYQNGTPGWSHIGSLHLDGMIEFSATGTVTIGPLDVSVSGSIPGFAEIAVTGIISGSLSGTIAGKLSPDAPSPIKPKNKPKGDASCLVIFPMTGSVKVESRTLLVGASGELSVTVNNPIGPLKLSYEAEDNCGNHP